MGKILGCLCALLFVSGCVLEPPPDNVASRSESIVDGERATDEDAVVLLYNREIGGLCTGTLISPRVVLTAKHCVQESGEESPSSPSVFVIGIGNSYNSLSETLFASGVETTPGVYYAGARGGLEGELVGKDVAVLTLARAVEGVTPIPVRRDRPSDQVGKEQISIGFGETPRGETGVKYWTTTSIDMISGHVIYTGPSICQGDSGGPLLQIEPKQVIGVASFGTGQCGSGFAGYQRLDAYMDIIDNALRATGVCVGDSEEVCDGIDNDCNDEVDEVCGQLGDACDDVALCAGGLECQNTPEGQVCTMACDPLRTHLGCPEGFFCARLDGCAGQCVAGSEGAKALGDACASHTECGSLHCADPGDGHKRCLAPCQGDAAMCLAGEVCAALPGECGGCVDADSVAGARGLGEPCDADGDCRSTLCVTDDHLRYCSYACETDDECGDGFHCRSSQCVRGERSDVGGGCLVTEDCGNGQLCATRRGAHFCTQFCTSDSACPTGFECTMVDGGAICATAGRVVGEDCTTSADCVSGVCATIGGRSMCTRMCSPDSPCSSGFDCRRAGDEAVCAPAPTAEDPGDCDCAIRGARTTDASRRLIIVIGVALLAAWRRRRRYSARRA